MKGAGGAVAVGTLAILAMLGGIGVWSVQAQIAGAVVAPGTVEVESERQVVQHPDGGVVTDILARDGDRVDAGQVLIRLDGTFVQSELAIVERQLAEVFARRARLQAERDGSAAPDFTAARAAMALDPAAIDSQIDGQRALFAARLDSFDQERRQLLEQQQQIDRQIDGIAAQSDALNRMLGLVVSEQDDVRTLFEKGLVPAARLIELQREEARLTGEIGRLTAATAEARTRISALAIEANRLETARREDATAEMRDLDFSEIELAERRASLIERLARLEVRAPVSGTVFDARVAAIGSVLRAAEPILYIVPGDQPLQIATRIDPSDADQVFPDQEVSLVLTAFNQRTIPQIPGRVLRLSADAQTDEATGQRFYEAVIVPDAEALASLDGLVLLPGMPVDAFLKTGDRTPLTYLTQPLTIYFDRAFRED